MAGVVGAAAVTTVVTHHLRNQIDHVDHAPQTSTPYAFPSITGRAVSIPEPKFGYEGQTLLPFSAVAGSPVISLQIGSHPESRLNFLINTDVSITWARSTLCISGNDCSEYKPKYAVPKKITLEKLQKKGDPRNTTYGEGSEVLCYNVKDSVKIAGLWLYAQPICAAYSSNSDHYSEIDGVIGLATYGNYEPTDVLRRYVKDSDDDAQIVSLWYDTTVDSISRLMDSDPSKDIPVVPNAGEISLGVPNIDRYYGPITWMPRDPDDAAWSVQLDAIVVGDKRIPLDEFTTARISTNQVGILLEAKLYDTIFGASAPQLLQISCRKAKSLPPISFVFDGQYFEFGWRQQTIKIKGKCYAAIMRNNKGGKNVFGTSFLKAVHTSYDMRNNRVGFAKARPGRSGIFKLNCFNCS